MNSREGITAAIRPVTMTAIESATAAATLRFCSTRKSAIPSLARSRRTDDKLLDDDRGESLRRLVHDDQPRIHQKRAGDREHLLLAA